MAISVASYTKKNRRTKQEIENVKAGIYAILEEDHPMTVRQVYYRLVSGGYIEKTDSEYNSTVVRLLSLMRRNHEIPFSWIVDSTRLVRHRDSYSSLESFSENAAAMYRRDLWAGSGHHIEVWVEKDTLSGVLFPVTDKWDVPLMVARGYSSLTFLQSNGEAIRDYNEYGYDVHIYQFGDHDPSGVDAARKIEEGLREFSGGVDFEFRRVAVTEEQIEYLNLPTRSTKKSDRRSKNFEGESVEIEAIPAHYLRMLCAEMIEQHVDADRYTQLQRIEREERRLIEMWGAV